MTIYKYPKIYEPPKGISSDGLFLFGPTDWQDNIIKKMKGCTGINIIKADPDPKQYSYNILSIIQSDVALFNFTGIKDIDKYLVLVTIGKYAQFPPNVFVYLHEKNSLKNFVEGLAKITDSFTMVEEARGLEKKAIELFSYLKGE